MFMINVIIRYRKTIFNSFCHGFWTMFMFSYSPTFIYSRQIEECREHRPGAADDPGRVLAHHGGRPLRQMRASPGFLLHAKWKTSCLVIRLFK